MTIEFSLTLKQKKICVIGATGFIGFACTKRLVEMGFENIHCVYRNENKKNDMFRDVDTTSITFSCGDFTQLDILRRAIKGADVVVNASGIANDWGVRQQIWDVNVNAPKAMVELIKEQQTHTHFIQLSSASVYGYGKKLKTEAAALIKSDRFYTASKVDVHTWLQEKIKQNFFPPITILAPSIVWGEGDQIYVPAIKELLKRKCLPFIGNAKPVDFIHIDDLVDAILLCFFNESAYNQDFIISGSNLFTFNQYIEKIAEFCDLSPPIFTVPKLGYLAFAYLCEGLAILINSFNSDYHPLVTRLAVRIASETCGLSSDKAKNRLGFRPNIDFNTGMERLKEYAKQCSVSKIYESLAKPNDVT